jgi:hypothetical protein
MRDALITTSGAASPMLSPQLYRAFGLAAVAAELNLDIDMLEPETAEAVARGAAALFLAGYGPKGIRSRPRRPFRWKDGRIEVRRPVIRSRGPAEQSGESAGAIIRH